MNKFQWNSNRNSYISIQEIAYQNVVCKMAAFCLGLNIISVYECFVFGDAAGHLSLNGRSCRATRRLLIIVICIDPWHVCSRGIRGEYWAQGRLALDSECRNILALGRSFFCIIYSGIFHPVQSVVILLMLRPYPACPHVHVIVTNLYSAKLKCLQIILHTYSLDDTHCAKLIIFSVSYTCTSANEVTQKNVGKCIRLYSSPPSAANMRQLIG